MDHRSSTDIPKDPHFINVPDFQTFENQYNGSKGLWAHIIALAKAGKPGVALNEIIEKLMPFIENYNMEYTQGNIANGQTAASYALRMTSYISEQYQKTSQPGGDPKAAAGNAIKAEEKFENVIHSFGSRANPFGSMGTSVGNELKAMTSATGTNGETREQELAKFWTSSWNMNGPTTSGSGSNKTSSSGTSSSGSGKASKNINHGPTNSVYMQDINNAQNQAQSEAAYLQSESKLANQNYEQYASVQHAVGQNVVSVESAANNAAKNAGN